MNLEQLKITREELQRMEFLSSPDEVSNLRDAAVTLIDHLLEKAEIVASKNTIVRNARNFLRGITHWPWEMAEDEYSWQLFATPSVPYGIGLQILKAPKKGTPYAEYWPTALNGQFIAEAPALVDRLLSIIDEQGAELDELRARMEGLEK